MAVASSSSSTTHHLLHYLLRPQQPAPPQPPLLSSFFRPLSSITTTIATNSPKPIVSNPFQSLHLHRTTTRPPTLFSSFRFSHSLSTPPLPTSPLRATLNPSPPLEQDAEEVEAQEQEEENDDIGSGSEILGLEQETEEVESEDQEEENDDIGIGSEMSGLELEDSVVEDKGSSNLNKKAVKIPNLTVKEKKELASYANSLGKKLKSQLVGKSGVTDNVATSFIETLEANELLKIKIHRTCPGELEDVVQRLQEATGSVVVGQIGRTVIIYRPSLAKLKAEEKRRQVRKVYVRKDSKLKSVSLPGREVPRRLSGRGRRGSSRV